MSVKVDIVTQAKDLPQLFQWLSELLESYPKQRFLLTLRLEVVEKKGDP